MRSLRHAVKSIENPEIKTRENGKTKNARENKEEFFAVPRYLARRVLGNQAPPLEHNSSHGTSLVHQYIGSSTRSGLRPNGFSLRLGHSDWASAALTFSEIYSRRLRQFASAPSSWHAAGAASGGVMPHFSRVLA